MLSPLPLPLQPHTHTQHKTGIVAKKRSKKKKKITQHNKTYKYVRTNEWIESRPMPKSFKAERDLFTIRYAHKWIHHALRHSYLSSVCVAALKWESRTCAIARYRCKRASPLLKTMGYLFRIGIVARPAAWDWLMRDRGNNITMWILKYIRTYVEGIHPNEESGWKQEGRAHNENKYWRWSAVDDAFLHTQLDKLRCAIILEWGRKKMNSHTHTPKHIGW